jgi:hypothetical protein
VLFRNVRIHCVLLTANCEVFVLNKYVVKTNVDDCVVGFHFWCYFRWGHFCLWWFIIPPAPLYSKRPVIEIQIAECIRLQFGVDNSQSCTLLLAVPASFGPDFRSVVGDPVT